MRPTRSFAFRSDPELLALWEAHRESPWMRRFGYDRLPVLNEEAAASRVGPGARS